VVKLLKGVRKKDLHEKVVNFINESWQIILYSTCSQKGRVPVPGTTRLPNDPPKKKKGT
jgi:hypothetical protein